MLYQLANMLLTLNAENATVEHSFNLLSRLQTPTKNRLLSSNADKLMHLKLKAVPYKKHLIITEHTYYGYKVLPTLAIKLVSLSTQRLKSTK